MARAAQGIALVAAAAVIGGLAWWMLKPADGPGPNDGETSASPSVPDVPGGGPSKSPTPKTAPSRPVGTLLAVVKGDGKPVAATLSAVPAEDLRAEPASALGSAGDGAVRLASAPAGV